MEIENSIRRDVRIREVPIAPHAQSRSVADTVTTYNQRGSKNRTRSGASPWRTGELSGP
jgi:hypothetical protein